MRLIFTTGTFDILHYGHINLLKKAKEHGDYLIVGVNVNPCGKNVYYSYENRKAILESIKYVDEVVPLYKDEDKFKYLKLVDIFVIGSDYKGYKDISDIEKYCKVKFIDRTPDISTTQLKKYISDQATYHTFVIDLDDTIVTVHNRDFINGIPNKTVISKINKLYAAGWKIIIYTARGAKSCKNIEERISKYKQITEEWLKKYNVKYTELVFGKMNADYYVDDKAMSITEFLNFKESY